MFAVGVKPMHRLMKVPVSGVVVAAGVLLMSAQSIAQDSPTHPRNPRRQMADCIIKRMSADRMVSFNDATKTCKAQAKMQGDNELASNTAPKSASGP
jgi:hypothetical protein